MIKTFLRTLPILTATALVACATPAPPRELVEARDSYKEASEGAAMRVNPSGVDTARDKLVVAETAFRDDPKSQGARDTAYLADRSARLAIAQAATKLAAEQQAAAQKQLGVVAQKNLSDLKKTQSELDLQRQAGQMTAAQLEEQKKALEAQKLTGAATQKELDAQREATGAAKLATAATEADRARIQAELDAEKVKRAEAEARAAKALANLADMAAVKEEARGLVITLSGQVLFASGKSALLPAAQKALDNVAEALKANPGRNIIVEGYTDSQGARAMNDQLSQDRANSVRTYLVSRGIASEIITARGYGPDRPVADNASPEGRANNRRVEIVLSPAAR